MPKPTETQIREVFEAFDADGSGGISSSEFKSVLTRLGIKATDQEIKALVELCDTDGSGVIEYNEFKKALLG